MICPNCCQGHQSSDRCVVAILLGIIEDRIDRKLTTEEFDRITEASYDVDGLWDAIGPWIDELQSVVLGGEAS